MKAVERAKLVRSLRQESRRLRLLVLVIGFFLVTVTYVVLSKPDALLFNLNGRLSVDDAPRSLLIRQATGADPGQRSAAAQDPKLLDDFEDARANGKVTAVEEEKRALTGSDPQQSTKKGPESQLLGSGGEGEKKGHRKVTLPTVLLSVTSRTATKPSSKIANQKQKISLKWLPAKVMDLSNKRAHPRRSPRRAPRTLSAVRRWTHRGGSGRYAAWSCRSNEFTAVASGFLWCSARGRERARGGEEKERRDRCGRAEAALAIVGGGEVC